MSSDLILHGFCILILCVLLISIASQKDQLAQTTFWFAAIVCILIAYLVANFITLFVDGKPPLAILAYIFNFISFILMDFLIIAVSAHLNTLIGTNEKKWKYIMNPGVLITYFRIVVIIVLAVTGNLFIIDKNGYYSEQPLSIIPYTISLCVLVILMLVVLRNRHKLSKRQTYVMLVYLFLPIPAALIEITSDNYIITGAAITLSVLLIYVLIQASIIENGRMRETILAELSDTDQLTGLNNRRAYYNYLSLLKQDTIIGAIFCDINGLKFTNDNFGHTAGDALIINFSKLLTESFDRACVFRLSGDEFVVLIPNVKRPEFEQKVHDFKNTVLANNSIAAVGSAFGSAYYVEHLVSVAENMMYEHKRQQHQEGVAFSRDNLK